MGHKSSICPWVVWNITADNNNAEEQTCQIGSFIFENLMDAVIIPENVFEPFCFPIAINNVMKKQPPYSNILKWLMPYHLHPGISDEMSN